MDMVAEPKVLDSTIFRPSGICPIRVPDGIKCWRVSKFRVHLDAFVCSVPSIRYVPEFETIIRTASGRDGYGCREKSSILERADNCAESSSYEEHRGTIPGIVQTAILRVIPPDSKPSIYL